MGSLAKFGVLEQIQQNCVSGFASGLRVSK